MKKRLLVFLVCMIFLIAMAKPQDVVPFLQTITKELKRETKVPILLPTYWTDRSNEYYKHMNVQYDVQKDGYFLNFLAMDKTYPPNDPTLEHHSLSNEAGSLSGNKDDFIPFQKPKTYVAITKINGIEIWAEPTYQLSVFGKYKKWTFTVDGVGQKDNGLKLTQHLLEKMNQFNWFENKDIKEGKVYLKGSVDSIQSIIITWESEDGFIYSFDHGGSIDETLKIIEGIKYIK